jgi:Zn finger protein HypA/HybF involved in hydrogenase expression
MVKTIRATICKHCKRQIKGKVKLVGLTSVCPYCEKPSEEMRLEREMEVDVVRQTQAT